MEQLTRENIINLLETNDHAVGRALLAIRRRQTADEQVSYTVKHRNNKGFRPCDARVGTSMADFYSARNFLSAKQLSYWRRLNSKGIPRIGVYWKQLIEEAKIKQG